MEEINGSGHPSASYTNCRCFLCRLLLNVALSKRKICYTAVKHNISVNEQLFCLRAFDGLAVHRYNNRVNNTRLLKQTVPLLLRPSSSSQKMLVVLFFLKNKIITTLSATDAAIAKTHSHWHSQFVLCAVLVFYLILQEKPKQTPRLPPP